jgi:protein-tyrosine phosphatase
VAAVIMFPTHRRIELEGVDNFRDLGGYRTHDGRTTRWRTVYRADGLHRLTPGDVDLLRPIGLRTVMDLRTEREIGEKGRFPFESHPVRFHHLSVIDRTWGEDQLPTSDTPAAEFLHTAYTSMLVAGGDRFAGALGVLAETDALPAVFHCAAGKDRTGLLAALLLGAVGVPSETIIEDYALTQDSMARQLQRLRADPRTGPSIDSVPSAFFAAEPEAMRRVLDDIDEQHGSIGNYVRWLGVTNEVIGRLVGLLITDE